LTYRGDVGWRGRGGDFLPDLALLPRPHIYIGVMPWRIETVENTTVSEAQHINLDQKKNYNDKDS
jgi:hypothetical protein